MRNGFISFISIFALVFGFAFNAKAATNSQPQEAFLGAPNASITIIEYGSLTCSHCAAFQKNVFPELNEKYIKTGKIKYIFRTLPTNPIPLATGLQVLADCAGPKRYELIDEFFAKQDLIFAAAKSQSGPLSAALRIAKTKGLNDDVAKACLNDDAMIEKVRNIAENGAITYNINSTPSFIMNGKLLDDKYETHTIAGFSKIIDDSLAKNQKPVSKKPIAKKPIAKKAKQN